MNGNTFKITAEYVNNLKNETIIMAETPEKAIEKAFKENQLPLNFIENLPIFWMNYDPSEKKLSISGSEQNYKVTLISKRNLEKSIFSNNKDSLCDIGSVTVEKI